MRNIAAPQSAWIEVDSSYWRFTSRGPVSVDKTKYICPFCTKGSAIKTNYCAHCGAKLREGSTV